jgi:hypothetical protein
MDDVKITAAELKDALAGDFDRLVEEMAEAMNTAQAGRIIADSEEPVRDANANFREQAFERAVRLLQKKQEAFSPSGEGVEEQGASGGDTSDGQRPSSD